MRRYALLAATFLAGAPAYAQAPPPVAAPPAARPAAPAPAPSAAPSAAPTAAGTPAAAEDPVLARVEGEAIKLSDVLAAAGEVLPPELRNVPPEALATMLPPEAMRQLVERTITDRALGIAARRQGLQNDPEIRARLARQEQQELTQALLRREVLPRVTDAAIRARYDRDYGNRPAEEEVRARHILVPTEAEARAALADIQRGQDFDAVGRRFAQGAGTRESGELGWFKRGDMVPEFSAAAFAMQAGQVSPQPVRTQFGWHVIRVDERRTGTGPSFDDSKEEIRQRLLQEEVQAAIERIRGTLNIERVEAPAAPGGLMQGAQPPAAAPTRR